jgi:hypothetical protein
MTTQSTSDIHKNGKRAVTHRLFSLLKHSSIAPSSICIEITGVAGPAKYAELRIYEGITLYIISKNSRARRWYNLLVSGIQELVCGHSSRFTEGKDERNLPSNQPEKCKI